MVVIHFSASTFFASGTTGFFRLRVAKIMTVVQCSTYTSLPKTHFRGSPHNKIILENTCTHTTSAVVLTDLTKP